MTEKLLDKLDEHKYNILYYVYFISCLLVALWVADPVDTLASLL
ncbi:MAG: hypothetical protein V5A66_01660 [Candidatus Thermoplasmatota archaeon]